MAAAPVRTFPPIPYGMADFRAMRLGGYLYVDKTRFLHDLEDERYALLLRPRRFGKTCLLSLLEHYYSRTRQDEFEALFAGTAIGREPTAERGRHVVLRFNFSAFDDTLPTLRERFEGYCQTRLRGALEANADLFPPPVAERVLSAPGVDGKLNELFLHAERERIPLCALIDEYDNFANTVLAHDGLDAYHAFTHGGGFLRNFFATLKAGTESANLERLFITGVSPVTMDDVTSGFNIGANLSFDRKYNELLGFTETEVRRLVDLYSEHGVFEQEADTALATMREWYNGYRFATGAEDVVYNTDMVLYYLKHSIAHAAGPERLIDDNVRIDYQKLRHLLVVNREASSSATDTSNAPSEDTELGNARPLALNGNFDLLRHVIAHGEVDSDLNPSFPVQQLAQRENFLTLLHCLGLLSIRGTVAGHTRLGIPNQTVRRLLYAHLRDAYQDAEVFSLDLLAFEQLTWAMARDGRWRPAVEFLADALQRQTSVRDYVDGERMLQGFLAAYLGAAGCFVFYTEAELSKGFADMVLTPLTAKHPALRHGYVMEIKYLRRESGGDAGAQSAMDRAKHQLVRYLADERLAREHPDTTFTGLALVFRGWELAACEAVEAAGE